MSSPSLQVSIICPDELKEVISAELDQQNFDGLWDLGDRIHAYISKDQFQERNLYNMLSKYGMENSYHLEEMEDKNWNQEWESNFKPFSIGKDVLIRASFHPQQEGYRYSLTIDPRMSFGTGHHETTELMIRMMLGMDLNRKRILDMGCGTGILAILAEKMGAQAVLAIDNDSNSVENTLDNLKYNQSTNVECILGEADAIQGEFDVVLSNITKNINITLLPHLANSVLNGGYVIISGFLDFDLDEVLAATQEFGLFEDQRIELNKWQCLKLIKR